MTKGETEETSTWRRGARAIWAGVSVVLLETVLLGVSLMPTVAFTQWQSSWNLSGLARLVVISLAFVPLYVLFALLLVTTSAVATRVLGWRTPGPGEYRLREFGWPVLAWGRYLMTIHVARVFAGPVFRATPFWSYYMRLNGARIGHLVWVNSLALMDHNLLDFGDGVVIGSEAHVSGHIIEHGLLKTARVSLGAGTVIGIGSVVGIGVETGEDTHVGALSVVPKYAVLEAGATYAGVPVQRIHH
jgi:acetyltransferase-like isoleucine patch superfamily enzyme